MLLTVVLSARGARDADGFIDFDALVAENQASTSGYTGDISAFTGMRIGSNGFRDSNVNRAVIGTSCFYELSQLVRCDL
jgi:hypothetical protein